MKKNSAVETRTVALKPFWVVEVMQKNNRKEETMEKEIKQAINTIDKLYILEDRKYEDYLADYDEFKKDIPKLKKNMDMLWSVKKYLINYE